MSDTDFPPARLVQGTSSWLGGGIGVWIATCKAFFNQHFVHVCVLADDVSEKASVFSPLSTNHLYLGPVRAKLSHSFGGGLAAGEDLLESHAPEAGLLVAPALGIVIEPGLSRVDAYHADNDFFPGLSAQDGGGISIFPKFYGAVLRGLSFLKFFKTWNFSVSCGGTRTRKAYCYSQ